MITRRGGAQSRDAASTAASLAGQCMESRRGQRNRYHGVEGRGQFHVTGPLETFANAGGVHVARAILAEFAENAPKVRFASDSLLEGDGFEPSVPGTKEPVLVAEGELRDRTGAAKKGCFLYGTDGSNPSPSSGESAKTLVWPSTPPTARVIFRGSRS